MQRLALSTMLICMLIVVVACSSATPAQPTAPQASVPQPAPTQAPPQVAQPTSAPTPQAAAQPTSAPTAAQAAAGGHITEVNFADAKSLNSVLAVDSYSGAVISMLGNGLVRLNPDNLLPIPDLATQWSVSPDNLTYTFTLRNDVKFHDGSKFTADDVKFTYELMLNEKVNSPRRAPLSIIDSITVKSPTEIEFKLKKVTADFLVTHATYQIVPKSVLGNVPPEAISSHDFNTKTPIYTGPFKFKEWVKDDHITLVANPDYFRGKPKIDEYVFKVVKDANVVAAQLKTGEADFGQFEPPLLSELQKQANLKIFAYPTFVFTFYSYQLDPARTTLFQDVRVRQALLYALDRQAMVDSIMSGQAVVANTTEPVLSWAYKPDVNQKYTYDAQKAEQLLDEAGWKKGADGVREKDGQKLKFTCYTNAGNKVRENYLTVMQEQWRKIGVDMTPKTEELGVMLDRILKTHDFECFLVGFPWGVDPNQKAMWHTDSYNGGQNMNKYSNKELDKILDDALNTTDVTKRKEMYFQMQEILMRDVPSVILDFPKTLAAVNKRVVNLEPKAVGMRNNAETWAVTDGK